jgi:FAD synthase
MNVLGWSDIDGFDPQQIDAVTIGVFDGVHRGHQHLLRIAQEYGRVCVVTFRDNPQRVLRPDTYPGDVCTIRQKMELLQDHGAACTVLVDFTGSFRELPGEAFIRRLVDRVRPTAFVVGSDFRCGVGLDTGAREIARYLSPQGIRVDIAEPLKDNGQSVSSTRVRRAVSHGDVSQARRLLGRPYVLDLRDLDGICDGYRIPRMSVTQVLPNEGSFTVRPSADGDTVDMTVFPDYIELHRAGRCDLIEFLNRKPTLVA